MLRAVVAFVDRDAFGCGRGMVTLARGRGEDFPTAVATVEIAGEQRLSHDLTRQCGFLAFGGVFRAALFLPACDAVELLLRDDLQIRKNL